MCWALIMTVESRLTRWIAERNKSTQPYQSRARRQSPTTKRSVLHVGLSWWVLYSNNKDREEYQQHGVSSYIRLSGAAMYSVIVIARAAEFIAPPWSAVKRRVCRRKATNLQTHSTNNTHSTFNSFKPTVWRRVAVNPFSVKPPYLMRGKCVTSCFVFLSICLVSRFNLIRTVGGRVNWKCNGGHVGHGCFLSFGAYHL